MAVRTGFLFAQFEADTSIDGLTLHFSVDAGFYQDETSTKNISVVHPTGDIEIIEL